MVSEVRHKFTFTNDNGDEIELPTNLPNYCGECPLKKHNAYGYQIHFDVPQDAPIVNESNIDQEIENF